MTDQSKRRTTSCGIILAIAILVLLIGGYASFVLLASDV